MGLAIRERLDADIRDALIAGKSATVTCASAGTLAVADVISALQTLEGTNWIAETETTNRFYSLDHKNTLN